MLIKSHINHSIKLILTLQILARCKLTSKIRINGSTLHRIQNYKENLSLTFINFM